MLLERIVIPYQLTFLIKLQPVLNRITIQCRTLVTKCISNEASIDFSDNQDAYVSAEVTQDDPALQSALEACNNYTKASITYTFGYQSTTLDTYTVLPLVA